MNKFALIENNNVQSIGDLPTNWNNVSNFSALNPNSPEELKIIKSHGWLPVETITENKQVYVQTEYVIEENCVKEIITTRDKTLQEIDEDNRIELEKNWSLVRNQRDLLLKQSDIEVVSDKWEQMTAERKSSWSSYRQILRDIPQNFSNPSDVIWPNLP